MTEIFDLLMVFLINTLLFVCTKQTNKIEIQKQPFKCAPNKKLGKILEKKL